VTIVKERKFTINLEKYENQWVALSHDEKRIVAADMTFKKAIEKAVKNGEDHPVMVKAPKMSAGYIL